MVVLTASSGIGRGAAAQSDAPRYHTGLPACLEFQELVQTRIVTRRQDAVLEERAGREGVIVVRFTPAGAGLGFTAWYDSLLVWREAAGERLTPDADALIGGRWRGELDGHGAVRISARPFMPPELLQVADLSALLEDFFPPLAPVPLLADRQWTDSMALTVARLGDSVAQGRTIQRYAWSRQRFTPADSAGALAQRIADEGWLAWDPAIGPLTWTRQLTVSGQTEPGVRGGPPLETMVAQAITVRQITAPDRCR